ncbi:hypothetical protein BOSEA31B_12933 [Hyphomicrobiales bacterium]|nr:hypothetical protein BOSEA31B_12933 [Hyphomicrobiales bacterium]CAH1698706.1 hypothetical protein BOSEA1005_11759 [Hyphomicrobiales bacterium]CAI0342353.1 hypothetical protein BO1005MUT1_180132 [Hyphomicrobiales bacterium]
MAEGPERRQAGHLRGSRACAAGGGLSGLAANRGEGGGRVSGRRVWRTRKIAARLRPGGGARGAKRAFREAVDLHKLYRSSFAAVSTGRKRREGRSRNGWKP